MCRLIAGALVLALVSACPASAAPYVSCPGGYIAPSLDQCPPIAKHPVGGKPPLGGGGGGGLLPGLLNHLGLGGLL